VGATLAPLNTGC